MKETLVAIHPGYYLDKVGHDDDLERKYGDYDDYLDRLYEAIASNDGCVIILYKKDHELPFDVPKDAEVLVDNFNDRGELIEVLKYKGAGSVALGGEFLWWYGRSVKPEEIRATAETLPAEKRKIIEDMLDSLENLDFKKLAEQGIYTKPFIDLFYSKDETETKGGCVEDVKKELEEIFSVRIIRELCYPVRCRPEPGN